MRDPDTVTTVMMSDKGRVIVPANLRRAIDMPDGGKLVIRVTERGTVELVPFETAVAEMRAMVAARLGGPVAVAEEEGEGGHG